MKNPNEVEFKSNNIFKRKYLDIKYSNKKASSYPKLLTKYIKKNIFLSNGKILDIGCGNGEMLSAFKAEGFDVHGTDIYDQSDDFYKKFNFTLSDIENKRLSYTNDTFDFTFSKSVIEHISNTSNYLDESYRILRPGGLNLIMTPSWVHNSWGPFYVDHTHIRPFTKKSLSDAMKMSGFKEVRVNYFYQLPILWKYPFLEIFSKITASLPIKYRPFDDSILPETLNTYVRFSNEVMLIGIGKK